MTPGAYIALIRDAVIVGAVLAILWFVHRADIDHIKIGDFKAVQAQLQENAKNASQNALRAQEADAQRKIDLDKVSAAIASNSQPVWVYRPSGASTVSCPATSPSPQSAGTGRIVEPSRADPQPIDIREPINTYEQRLETIVADCRAAIEKWPR